MALALRRSHYCVFMVPTPKTKTFLLKLGRIVELFLVISNACVDEGGGGWHVCLGFFLILFHLRLQIEVSAVLLLAAAQGWPAPLNSAQRSTSAQTCSWDYGAAETDEWRQGNNKSMNQPQGTGRCGTKWVWTDTGMLVEEIDASLGAVEKTCWVECPRTILRLRCCSSYKDNVSVKPLVDF